jgi:hypothetical protein
VVGFRPTLATYTCRLTGTLDGSTTGRAHRCGIGAGERRGASLRGRRWLDEFVAGSITSVEQIAVREKCSIRQVNMTISLDPACRRHSRADHADDLFLQYTIKQPVVAAKSRETMPARRITSGKGRLPAGEQQPHVWDVLTREDSEDRCLSFDGADQYFDARREV